MMRNFLRTTANKIRHRVAESGVAGRLAGLALLCGVGAFVTLPGLDSHALAEFFRLNGGSSLLQLYNWIVGGAVARGALVGIGIMPLLSAKVYLYLAKKLSPKFAAMMRGESGHMRLTKWTRGLTLGLAVVQSYGFAKFVQSLPGVVANPGLQFVAQTVLLLTAGAMGITLLSEKLRAEDEFSVSDETNAESTPKPADTPLSVPADAMLLAAGDAQPTSFAKSRESVGVERE
ncbi:MAG: hypothetical protein ABI852_04000 [Gemmatimonadaceae bacterium]